MARRSSITSISRSAIAAGLRTRSPLRFGIRHVTYEFSLFDSDGRLRRVEVDVAGGSARGERLIDNRHEAIKKAPNGWAASLTKAGETSPAVREISTIRLQLPHLTLRVNGVRILARGGNWGMDDSRKRISARAARALLPAAEGRESQHRPQLDGQQRRGRVLRSLRRIRPA